jgi:hypothetical protein
MQNLIHFYFSYDMIDLGRIYNDEDFVMSRALFEHSSVFLVARDFLEI